MAKTLLGQTLSLIDEAIPNFIDYISDGFLRFSFCAGNQLYELEKLISPTLGTRPDPKVTVTRFIRYGDPLILDLDGDGIEITPLAGSESVRFDPDGTGVKIAMAWTGADDGMLVLDRNGNGAIDSGRELFGDETLLANGSRAEDGFHALAELDTGSIVNGVSVGAGDGVFNELDESFASVRLWRDLNQDGISQADELQTLAEAGVASINLTAATVSRDYPNAILTDDGTYTRTDGSTGQAGSFILAQDGFHQSFPPITISEPATLLPNIQGSGWVRGLREAATLDPDIVAIFQSVQGATGYQDFRSSISDLLISLADTSGYISAADVARQNGYTLILQGELLQPDENGDLPPALLDKLFAYEAFTGHTFLSWSTVYAWALQEPGVGTGRPDLQDIALSEYLNGGQDDYARMEGNIIVLDLLPSAISAIRELWDRLVADASSNLASIRLAAPLDQIQLVIDAEGGVELDFTGLDNYLQMVNSTNTYEAAMYLLDLRAHYGNEFASLGWDVTERFLELLQQSKVDANVARAFSDYGFHFMAPAATAGTSGDDLFVGGELNDTTDGGAGNDLMDGAQGDDSLSGGVGDDMLLGGLGNDTLNGGDGNDILDGGAGNDGLRGGYGNNTYRFGVGDGQDYLYSQNDSTAGKANVLEFKDGVTASMVTASRSGDALILGLTGTTDTVTVEHFFYQDNPANSYNPLQQVRFADGTVWGIAEIVGRLYAGTDGNDTIAGTSGADLIGGGLGDDSLFGQADNDTLNGGTGNDTLNGGDGDDILDGGAGNDGLRGGYGNNTYRFGVGDGQDYLYSQNDSTAGKANVLEFKDGVTASMVTASRSGDALILGLTGTTDTVTVEHFFYQDNPANSYNPLQQVRFADGTVWGIAEIVGRLYAGTDGNDTIVGTNGADLIGGGLGDDSLFGQAGNDILEGGLGNDTLINTSDLAYMNGGAGNDTFTGGASNELFIGGTGNDTLTTGNGADILVFNRGDGADTVNGGTGTDNTVSLGGGIRYADMTFSKSSNDLVLNVGNGEKLTFQNWYITSANNKTASTLQVILEATADYNPGGGDALTDNKVEQFDFAGLVTQFDAARAANPALSTWALSNALTGFHLGGSDTAALGGDLAYWYGRNGNLTGMNVAAAQEVIGGAGFGTANQTLREFSGISGGLATLG
jgi:Ca2+-binding RTX toxin-like protein